MWINTSTDYAVKMILLLAQTTGTVSSSKLSKAVGVSPRYLLQIGARLRDAGLVNVIYGPAGGYQLARPSSEISLLDVITAMEKRAKLQEDQRQVGKLFQVLHYTYEQMDVKLSNLLSSITMEDLLTQTEQ